MRLMNDIATRFLPTLFTRVAESIIRINMELYSSDVISKSLHITTFPLRKILEHVLHHYCSQYWEEEVFVTLWNRLLVQFVDFFLNLMTSPLI
ncbi:hypothetical protein JTB14_008624 [Gonioctena quinquepunctata]|nr:hypothetical protein JTB14_008624 [Gonioctena quinquepunctata]